MDRRSVSTRVRTYMRFALAGYPAAAFGSVVGTMVVVSQAAIPCAHCYTSSGQVETAQVAGAMLMSLVGTVPGAMLVGVPVAYALRRRIAARPLYLALPMALIGMAAGTLLLGWAFRGAVNGDFREIGWLWAYCGATASGFVPVIAWRRRQILDAPG